MLGGIIVDLKEIKQKQCRNRNAGLEDSACCIGKEKRKFSMPVRAGDNWQKRKISWDDDHEVRSILFFFFLKHLLNGCRLVPLRSDLKCRFPWWCLLRAYSAPVAAFAFVKPYAISRYWFVVVFRYISLYFLFQDLCLSLM